jgi:hypothetical protein
MVGLAQGQAFPAVQQIERQPANLGIITVRISLKQDALNIRIEVDWHDTARLLETDHDQIFLRS